jgi:hypothetical protein
MPPFDPNRSRVTEDALADFIKTPLSGDLLEVPGIGEKTVEILVAAGVVNTYQLIGKFITLKSMGESCKEHCQKFYDWLMEIEAPPSYRAGVTLAIAEKVNTWMPGLYDPSVFAE